MYKVLYIVSSECNNKVLYIVSSVTSSDSAPMRTGALAPGQQISMDKLVVALQYLGYSPSQSQLVMLKQRLVIGPNNQVSP